jgi:hypothetical protein
MNYIVEYNFAKNNINSEQYLSIYDFGYAKGYLFKDTFRLFELDNSIADTNKYIEECKESFGPIPLRAFSIESYPCIFDKDYITSDFTIKFFQKHIRH